MTCAGPDCDRPAAGTYCHAHKEQLRRRGHGSTLTPLRIFASPQDRFASFVVARTDGCLIWTGATDGGGRYGSFFWDGRVRRAHKVAFEWASGPVPDGLVLDHLCRVTLCVNPDHLEPVTQRENILRGGAPTALNALKTHCPQGHAYTSENTRVQRTGGRVCRTCERSHHERYRLRRLAARAAA